MNWHLAEELSKHADVRVVGPQGAKALQPKNVGVVEAPLKPLSAFLLVAFSKGLWEVIFRRPDIILAGSGLTAPIAFLLSRLCRAQSVVYLHGFDITANHLLYRKLWRPFFKYLDCIVVNSSPTRELALAAGISSQRTHIVHPGVSLPAAAQTPDRIAAFRVQYGLIGKKVLLSVGRLTTRKGLREFVEHSLPSIIQSEPNAILVVIGEAPQSSLGASVQTEASIRAQAEQSGVADHIKFLGVITDKDRLAIAYEVADVHVFPVRHIPDDPEGFGMVAIEAAAHGLPTVAFATGGVIDAVKNEISGYLVENDNYHEFSRRVLRVLNQSLDVANIQKFGEQFSWRHFGEDLRPHLTREGSEK